MAFWVFSRYIAFSSLLFCALSMESVDKVPNFSFSFENFEKNRNYGSRIALYGDAEVRNSTIKMFGKGRIMCKKPIRFLGTNPSFSTNFSFSISESNGGGVDFLMVPKNPRSRVSPKFLVVKFGTGYNGTSHIAIDVGNEISTVNWVLDSEQKLHSWIDYDGVLKMIEVRVSKSKNLRPSTSIISCPVDLSNALWREAMYVGISSSNGNSSSIYSWSFEVKHGAPYNMHSEPLDPESFSEKSDEVYPIHTRRSFHWKILMALFVGVVCGALVASIVFYLQSEVVKRYPIAPVEYPEKIVFDGNKISGSSARKRMKGVFMQFTDQEEDDDDDERVLYPLCMLSNFSSENGKVSM